MIRKAIENDLDDLWLMGKKFYNYVLLEEKGLKKDRAEFKLYMRWLLENENTIIFVAESNGKIIGSIAGIFHPWFMDSKQKIITEQWLWVNTKFRGKGYDKKLLDILSAWGKNKGAEQLIMVSIGSEKEESLKKYYRRKGYKYLETHFIKEI